MISLGFLAWAWLVVAAALCAVGGMSRRRCRRLARREEIGGGSAPAPRLREAGRRIPDATSKRGVSERPPSGPTSVVLDELQRSFVEGYLSVEQYEREVDRLLGLRPSGVAH